MQETWRWFGPDDTVSLEQIVQAGASGVVTALDHIPTGEAGQERISLSATRCLVHHGLEWSVVESVPVHQDIKLRKGDYQRLIENYRTTLKTSVLRALHASATTLCPLWIGQEQT